MSVIYDKFKDGNICIEVLEDEIENSSIGPDLELIVVTDNYYIALTFNVTLSSSEENDLDHIILTHSCDSDEEISKDFDDFATVQLKNPEAVEINPTKYRELKTNTVIIENHPQKLKRNGSDDNVLILEDGLYNISYNGILSSDVSLVYFEFFIVRDNEEFAVPNTILEVDQTQALPWERYGYGPQYHRFNVDININTPLKINDILKIKALKVKNPYYSGNYARYFPRRDEEVYAYIQKGAVLSVTKLNGATGPKGEDGPPGNTDLTLKKGGAIKAANVDTINFNGNVTVTNNSNGQASVNILESNTNQFFIHQIYGADNVLSEPMAFLVDKTRKDKILSIESSALQFGEHYVSNNDWFVINDANHTYASFAMPYDGTVIRAVASCADTKNGGYFNIYINKDKTEILKYSGNESGQSNDYRTNLNLSFEKGDIIRMRASEVKTSMRDIVITVWVKWEFNEKRYYSKV